MKKLTIILLGILLMYSCCENQNTAKQNFEANSTAPHTGDLSTGMVEEAYEFTYKGHDYVDFEGSTSSRGISMVHRPDCTNPACVLARTADSIIVANNSHK